MVIVTSNKAKRLLFISFIEKVHPAELKSNREDIKTLLTELSPGFRLLVDYSPMESMDLDCAPEIGRTMELIDRSGVSMVVRVIPDSTKDIGMNILTLIHYRSKPHVITCCNLAEAFKKLEL
jgi:hypothetical protein